MSGSSITFQMQGLAALTARLQALDANVQGKAVKAGMRAAGNVIKKEIIAQAPYDGVTPDDTHIRKNVVVGRSRSKSSKGCEAWTVGIKLGSRVLADTSRNRAKGIAGKKVKTEGDTWYWKLHEFGSSHQSAKPFIRPAAAAAASAALAAFEKKLGEAITKFEQNSPP